MFLVMTLCFSSSAAFANQQEISSSPRNSIVNFEVLNTDGTPLPETNITVIYVKNNEVVFQGKSDELGRVSFQSSVNDTEEQSNDMYKVFEVYYASPIDNELQREVFSAPVNQNGAKLSKQLMEDETNVKLQFKGEKDKTPQISLNSESASTQSSALAANGTCIPGPGAGWQLCTETDTNYLTETRIGTINVGSNETGTVKLNTKSTVKLSAGYKRDSSPWSFNGEVTKTTTNGTTVDYTIPGKVIYDNGSHYNAGVYFYAFYNVNYKKKTMYYWDVRQWDEYTITPVELNGGSQRLDYFASSNNGQASGKTDPTTFTVGTVSSTTKYNSSESSLSGGFSVSTPAGTFSGNVNTSYASETGYTWKSNTAGVTYYHYKRNGIYHVTS
ncbi:hypothetical protein SAMN05444162_3042 [Paenibacillaceae bacterium GAS479]|nr:hypothetical protein SAMN05444162_3042 [Paenibacillaceae bacterium GAS479]